jgi:hypothetical protein
MQRPFQLLRSCNNAITMFIFRFQAHLPLPLEICGLGPNTKYALLQYLGEWIR